MLNILMSDGYSRPLPEETVQELAESALWVNKDNVALHNKAGGIRPADHLPADEAAVLLAGADHLCKPESQWPSPIPRACHRVHPKAAKQLYRRMLDCGLAVLVPLSDIPRDSVSGEVLRGGFFGVPKKGRPN